MASKTSTRPSATKNIEEIKRKNRTANLQWAAIAIVMVLAVLAVFVFGWGAGDGHFQHG